MKTVFAAAAFFLGAFSSEASATDCVSPTAGFPGQHVPTPPDWKFPVWSAACANAGDVATQLACANFNLEDWPRLSRYAEANKCVPTLAKGERRVVFLGDSITDNWSRPGMGGFFAGKPYINRGIGGQTTAHMLLRFRPDVIALQPKVVVILAGTNDIGGNSGPATLQDIQNNLASMADLARANGIRVVLASVPPVTNAVLNAQGKPVFMSSERRILMIPQVNAWLKDFAKSKGHVYLDYFAALADTKGVLQTVYTYDGLHPNAQGYGVMAPLAEAAISRALKK